MMANLKKVNLKRVNFKKVSLNKIAIKMREYFKTNILFMAFVSINVINAWLVRYFTVGNIFDGWPFIGDLIFVLLIGAFGYLFKTQNQYRYFLTFTIVFSIFAVVNAMYYRNFNSFTSISLLATSTQLIGVADAIVFDVLHLRDFALLWPVIALVFVDKDLKKRHYYRKVDKMAPSKIRALNTLFITGLLFVLFASNLSGVDISRLGKQWNREFIVTRYGLYIYHANDVVSSLQSSLTNLFGYDEAAKLFDDYFSERDETPSINEFTNIFEGKNMILIHAESFQTFVMDLEFNDVELTPNINRLAREGMFFSNFYAQDAVGTSSDSEFTLNTSLMPVNSGTVAINYFDRYFYSIPKLLKEKDYFSFSMHANNGTYWNRSVLHPSLGYDYFYYYDKDFELDEIIQLGLSDKSFFRQAVPYIEEIHQREENFYGTLITLTNHTPFRDIVEQGIVDFDFTMKYNYYDEELEEEVEEIISYLEGTRMGNYLTSIHYADAAMGLFVDLLLETDVMDDTVLIIYGDHDAKLRRGDYDILYNYDPETDDILDSEDENYIEFDFYRRELYKKVPLVIWTKDEQFEKEITEVMGMYDVMPTLGNMFNFYNPYALGNDIFSVEENVVVFPSGNWLTNEMYYNTQRNEAKIFDPEGFVNVEKIEYYEEYADRLLTVSRGIIIHDLFLKLVEREEEV